MWLRSKKGDYGRSNPGMGGPLDEFLGKIVSQERAISLQAKLEEKIRATFNSILTVDSLIVTPLPDRKMFQISLTTTYLLIKKAFTITTELSV
jgi:hypothetical protein